MSKSYHWTRAINMTHLLSVVRPKKKAKGHDSSLAAYKKEFSHAMKVLLYTTQHTLHVWCGWKPKPALISSFEVCTALSLTAQTIHSQSVLSGCLASLYGVLPVLYMETSSALRCLCMYAWDLNFPVQHNSVEKHPHTTFWCAGYDPWPAVIVRRSAARWLLFSYIR